VRGYTSLVGASVTLVNAAAAVEPGQEAAVDVRVRNTGTVVDEFTLEVLGDSAGWATVEPSVVSLFPGAEGTARIVFRPPRQSSTPAGSVPYGLRARSHEDPAGSAVEEGSVEVGSFQEPFAELVPRTSRGSRSGSHDLAVDNRGNARLSAEIEATDADRLLKFDVRPPALVVEPGMAEFAKLRVSPVKRFWRGTPKTRPFKLRVTPEGGAPISLDGTLLQESMLPAWFVKALIALVLLLIVLVVLWLFVLQPSIKSAASEAVASPLASLKADVNSALGAAGLATIPPGGGAAGGPTPSPAPTATTAPGDTPAPTATPGTPVIPGLGNAVDGHLDATTTSFAPKGTLFITDFVFSNPNGREGALVVLRDTSPLLQLKLENFRDYDLHFVTPIVINDGQSLNLSLVCSDSVADPCNPAVFYSGYLKP
jgi:hypothetical protein